MTVGEAITAACQRQRRRDRAALLDEVMARYAQWWESVMEAGYFTREQYAHASGLVEMAMSPWFDPRDLRYLP